MASPALARRRDWVLGFLLIAAAALRFRAACNDLWLDEIWSVDVVRKVSSPLDIFTSIHLDNNHYLNSLWLWLLRGQDTGLELRLLSILTGVGCVILAGMIARRYSARAGFFAVLLMTFSYAQVLYSSEARGYAEVVFFSFAAFYALDQYLENQSPIYAVIFSLSSIFGFIADVIFVNFYAAAIAWSIWRFSRGVSRSQLLKSMLACHSAPTLFFLTLYLVDVRHLIRGGGTASTLPVIFGESMAWAIGTLSNSAVIIPISLLSGSIFLAGIWLLWRQRTDSWIFFLGVILVFPIVITILHRSNIMYVRHFMIGMSFMLILLSLVLAALYEHGATGRLLCVGAIASFIILNGLDTVTLFKYGRGQYSEALRFLIQNTKGPELTIGSDHDFRVSTVLQYYVERATGDKTIEFYPRNSWPRQGPEWLIYHKESVEKPEPTDALIIDGASNHYEFVRTFPSAPLSGLHWFIYHNERAAPNAAAPIGK